MYSGYDSQLLVRLSILAKDMRKQNNDTFPLFYLPRYWVEIYPTRGERSDQIYFQGYFLGLRIAIRSIFGVKKTFGNP